MRYSIHALSKGTLWIAAGAALALSASCGGDGGGGGGTSGSSGSGAGATGGTGGVGGAAGTAGVGGGVGGAAGTAGVGGGVGGSGPAGSPCCGGIGVCADTSQVPPDAAKNLNMDICPAGQLCAPQNFQDPTFVPPTCTSASNAEGRCVNECFTAGVNAAQFLPQDICQLGEKCVPCFNPIDGTATGACTNNGDMPTQPPVVFADCCENQGKCVPKMLVPPERQEQLPQDTCTGMEELCAPTVVINDPDHVFAGCTANILLGMHPGACVPKCLAGDNAALLAQETCQPGELCAPCVNPLTMVPTGACGM